MKIVKVRRRSRVQRFVRIGFREDESEYEKAMMLFEETRKNYYNAFRQLAT